ncbi:MAG: toxic anion resistance protein [Calditrichaeota bacterium]|nr:toxic anion resistance protein [Calditrichota bacterium]
MNQQSKAAVKEQTDLVIVDESKISQELALVPPESISLEDADPELDAQADKFLNMLLSGDYKEGDKRSAIDGVGLKTQEESTQRSNMLRQPIRNLAKAGEDGGPVAKSLLDLKEQVEELDPVNFDFTAGGFSRLLQKLPFIGKPINRYFQKFMSAESVIDAIITSLQTGRDQLTRDNTTLSHDQENMSNSMEKLTRAIQLGHLLDQKLQYKLDREISPEDDLSRFIKEELMFPLRQRIMDLQQSLAVNQQGVLIIEIIIRNNRELIRGVARALNVTVTALQVAIACALALANQRIVLKKINALNVATTNIIGHTAERLKTQGVEIHKQASESMLDIATLKKAFQDIKTAMEDISKFRQEALPQMANNILRMDQLTSDASEAIERMEQGTKAQPAIEIDVE